MQVRWNLLERQVVVLVAVSTAGRVEVFALYLLLCQGWFLMATGNHSNQEKKGRLSVFSTKSEKRIEKSHQTEYIVIGNCIFR